MARQWKLGTTATTVARERDTGVTRVTYHNTNVVRFDDHTVTLDSGRWLSATTKTRMNQASRQFGLGYTVYQRDFDWYVTLPDGTEREFVDGMTFEYRTLPTPALERLLDDVQVAQ